MAIQLGVGYFLGRTYRATASDAHTSVAALRDEPLTRSLQAFHYWGSLAMLAIGGIALIAMIAAGRFGKDDRPGYFGVLLAFAATMGFQITGNLLPWDRHGVQTAAIEASVASRVPGVGNAAVGVLFGGDGVSEATLERWYMLHRFGLPALALIALILLGVGISRNRPGVRGSLLAGIGLPLVVTGLAMAIASPLGAAAMPDDAVGFDALPSIYTYPAHALLVFFDRLVPGMGWIGATIVPAVLGLGALLLPILKPPTWLARVLLVAVLGFVGYVCATAGASVAPLTGTRDPAAIATEAPSAPASPRNDALAERGRRAFEEVGCSGCHGQAGVGGPAGPRLTELHRRHPDADWYMQYIRDPQSVKKGSTMPAFSALSESQLQELAEYLRFPQD